MIPMYVHTFCKIQMSVTWPWNVCFHYFKAYYRTLFKENLMVNITFCSKLPLFSNSLVYIVWLWVKVSLVFIIIGCFTKSLLVTNSKLGVLVFKQHWQWIVNTVVYIICFTSFLVQMTDAQGSEVDVQVDDVLKLIEDFSRLHW